jgi:transposase-like protein
VGWEHEADTVWRAQELYCVDRLSFDAVARETGVAASTLKRWAEKYAWQAKREEIAKAEADIRVDKVMARARTLKALLDKPKADMAFAVSALETLAMKEAEIAERHADRKDSGEVPPAISVKTPAEATAALRKAVEGKLGMLLTQPGNVNLKAVQEVQKCLELIGRLEESRTAGQTAGSGDGGRLEVVFVEASSLPSEEAPPPEHVLPPRARNEEDPA